MYQMILDTDNFRFEAFGETEGHAKETMRRAWNAHRRATGATYTFKEACGQYGLHGKEVVLGAAYRDGWEVK